VVLPCGPSLLPRPAKARRKPGEVKRKKRGLFLFLWVSATSL